jgi:hypothetical protein
MSLPANEGIIPEVDGECVYYEGQLLGCNACQRGVSPSALASGELLNLGNAEEPSLLWVHDCPASEGGDEGC